MDFLSSLGSVLALIVGATLVASGAANLGHPNATMEAITGYGLSRFASHWTVRTLASVE